MKPTTVSFSIFSLANGGEVAMKPHLRALAQLIVFFLSFHAVTWAGDRDPGHHFALAAHLQAPMAWGGGGAGVELRYQTSDVNLLLKDRMKRLNQCWKSLKDANIPQAHKEEVLDIYTALLRGQEAGSALVPTPEENEAGAEDFEQTLQTGIDCLNESLQEPRIQQDPALVSAVSSHKSLAFLKKKQLEGSLNAQDNQVLLAAEQDFMSTQQSVAVAEEARLRGQVIEQETPETHYQYATHLYKHQLQSQTAMDRHAHLLIAAQAGHVEAARQLLNQRQPGYYSTAGAVFFQLYQLGGEGQASFSEVTQARFLMHAIEAGDIGALDYLNQQTYRTLKNNWKSGQGHRHPEWKSVRYQWMLFANQSDRLKRLMSEIDSMYQTGMHQPLPLLKDLCPSYQPDTDSDDEDGYQAFCLARQQSEELKQKTMAELSREKEALASALKTSQQQQADAERTIAQLQEAYRLERQRKTQKKATLREPLAQLPTKKAKQVLQLCQPGDLGFGVGVVPEGCLPPNFSKLPGSEDIDSDEYGNYMHEVAGMHVWIPACVYRVGQSATAALFEKYGAHAIEVLDLGVYLSRLGARARARLIERLAQGQPGPGDWQLHRAFVNAGVVQAGFFMQKYLASKHGNGRSVTSVAYTVPLSLTIRNGYTRSADIPGCAGQLYDAYVLAKQTSGVHQVASLFQYSALTMLSLAQAQGAASNQYCAWWSADPRGCCPKGCVGGLYDDQKVNLVWQSAGEPDPNKPLTGSCSDPAWASFNGQSNGVMDIKGALWEVAGAVTTGSENCNPETLWALAYEMDYIALDQDTAFGTEDALRGRGDVPVRLPYRVDRRLDGTFPLFSGDATYDALALPKSVDAKGLVWPGYDHSWLYTQLAFASLMPVVGGWWGSGTEAGMCARLWSLYWDYNSHHVGLRLSAYGLTWTALAGASGE